ncbi:hypothetical protein DBR06_SOUSAS710038, partial [Sousa chinensis]
YASLYFCIWVDVHDNNPAIYHFVEILNKYCNNVCELSAFTSKVYSVTDLTLVTSKICETSQMKVPKRRLRLQSLE